MTPRDKRWKAFLSHDEFPERRTGKPVAVSPHRANFLHVLPELSLLSQRSFLSPRHANARRNYSGRAAILSRERPGAFPAPSHPPLISPLTYRLALPPRGQSHAADEVGLSPVNVVSRFVQAIPPITLMVRES